ncbi:MAG: hydrogenase assembly protein HupF, partial [Actinomycetota bacterium]|nr:hydrogenase assembly protein HupF [Actinomycetota bacterium]
VCFEHPGLLKAEPECTDDVCITCSDQGVLAEVIGVEAGETLVRTPEGSELIDTSLVDPPRPNDLLLVHAGSAITNLGGA